MKPDAGTQGTAEEIDLSGEWESVWQVEEPKPETARSRPESILMTCWWRRASASTARSSPRPSL